MEEQIKKLEDLVATLSTRVDVLEGIIENQAESLEAVQEATPNAAPAPVKYAIGKSTYVAKVRRITEVTEEGNTVKHRLTADLAPATVKDLVSRFPNKFDKL